MHRWVRARHRPPSSIALIQTYIPSLRDFCSSKPLVLDRDYTGYPLSLADVFLAMYTGYVYLNVRLSLRTA